MSSILVNTSVLHLSPDERKQAMSMLLLLGLSKYTACTDSQLVDMAALQRLHAKSLVEIGNRPGKFPNKFDKSKAGVRPKSAPSSSDASPGKTDMTAGFPSPPKAATPSRTKIAGNGGRAPRPNATESFPFTDSEFNASDLISCAIESETTRSVPASPTESTPAFQALSPAVRGRLAARAFADYAQGSSALRLSEVPKAMAALGLSVREDLHNALLARARVPPGSAEMPQGNWAKPDPTVQLDQWKALVERYVDQDKVNKIAAHNDAVAQRVRDKMDGLAKNAAAATAVDGEAPGGSSRRGRDSSDGQGQALVEALLSIEAIDGQSALEQADAILSSTAGVAGAAGKTGSGSDAAVDLAAEDAVYKALGRGIVEARNRLNSLSPEQRRRIGAARMTAKVQASGTGSGITGATRKRWDATLSAHIAPPVNASKSLLANKMKNVPSKIGKQVRSDRSNFKYNQGQNTDAALKSVAHTKVEILINGRGKRGAVTSPEDTDLTSGSSAMHIADAFLRGPVGQSLADMESEANFSLQHQEFLNRSLSGERRDMQSAIDEVDFLLSAGDYKLNPQARDARSMNEQRFNAASEAARQQREENERLRRLREADDAKPAELPNGWESKNGGFVAEFNTPQGTAHFRR